MGTVSSSNFSAKSGRCEVGVFVKICKTRVVGKEGWFIQKKLSELNKDVGERKTREREICS